jgi:hypothetical protein
LIARRLTPLQSMVVDEFLIDLDPDETAKRCGITKRRVQKMLKHPYVAEAIEIVMRQYLRRLRRSSTETARPSPITGAPSKVQSASPAVVSDDGQTIQLTSYAQSGAVAAALLDPVRAVALADELIRAALQRLSS